MAAAAVAKFHLCTRVTQAYPRGVGDLCRRRWRSSERQWTRLVRFKEAETGRVLFGQADNCENLREVRVLDIPTEAASAEDTVKALFEETGDKVTERTAIAERLLSPVPRVPIFLCLGLNYRRHAEEVKLPLPKYPMLFTKPPNALNHPDSTVLVPQIVTENEVDYEGELAVVIGRPCKDVSKEHALNYVLGYTAGNDISARKWQGNLRGGGQWCFSKSFDGFAPIGPTLVRASEVPDPQKIRIQTRLNRRIVQDSQTSDMIFSVADIISFLSQGTTLMPGTVIFTGTPEGVGFKRTPPVYLQHGDHVEIDVEGIGKLRNKIAYESRCV